MNAPATQGVTYKASRNMALFHKDDHFVRALMGPIGSGKSVACSVEIMLKAFRQAPDPDGIRRTRFAIIRNTYRELVDTTMQTFFDWVPESLGRMLKKDMKWEANIPLPDNTVVNLQILFRALDKPTDVKKLLSLELTGAWINEARELPKAIMDMLIGRLGRYPKKINQEYGPTWHGLIMDTNPPDSDHWWYKLFEVKQPSSYALFKQPSGIGPDAENLENLPNGYYTNMQDGKDQEWINVYVHGMYGFVTDGKPVYPEYKDDIHSSMEHYTPIPNITIYVGLDFGLTPAALIAQKTPAGRWMVFDELVTEDMGAVNFSKLLKQKLSAHKYKDFFENNLIEIYGDPSGDIRSQTDEETPFDILDNNGIIAWPTFTNDFLIRREAMAATLCRLDFAGNIGFCITPGAPMFRKAMAGGYKYKRMAVSGAEKFQDKPDKGRYSHVAEAGQYLMLGAGEADNIIGGYDNNEPDYSNSDEAVI